MSVRVFLAPHKRSFRLNREKLQTFVPDSLFTQALQLEPEAKEIRLENPLVTPQSILILKNFLEKGQWPKYAPKGLADVGQYLNIPWLELFSHDHYPEWYTLCQQDLHLGNWNELKIKTLAFFIGISMRAFLNSGEEPKPSPEKAPTSCPWHKYGFI